MDQRLVAWARSVKARRRLPHPPLWLFTDPDRMDVLALAGTLPSGLCGIVFRHDAAPGRAVLAGRLARICRARRLALTIAGDWRLAAALGTGAHIRLSHGERARRPHGVVTASAHTLAEILSARHAGATLVFLSPVFRTASHQGARTLGPRHFAAMARACPLPLLGLGGMDGGTVRRLAGAACAGAGAIDAFTAQAGKSASLGGRRASR